MRIVWYLLILSLPFTDYSVSPEGLRHGGQLSTFFVILLWTAYIGRSLSVRKFEIPAHRGMKYFGFFFVVAVISGLNSSRVPGEGLASGAVWIRTLEQVVQLALSGSVYFFALLLIRNRQELMRSLRAYLAAYILVLVYGLAEIWNYYAASYFLTGLLDAFHSFKAPFVLDLPRVWLVQQEPSLAAHYLLSVLPFLVLGAFGLRSKYLTWCLAFSGVFLLLFTFSIGGYLCLLVVLFLAALYIWKGTAKSIVFVTSVVVLLLVPSASRELMRKTYDRFSRGYEDPSVMTRLAEAQTGFNTFLSHPVVGVGLGNGVFYVKRDYPEWAMQRREIPRYVFFSREGGLLSVNNMVVRVLSETGLIGFVFFLLWHVELFRSGLRPLQRSRTVQDRKLSLAMLGAAAALTIEYFSASAFHLRYVFFVFGLIPAWTSVLRTEQPASQPAVVARSAVPMQTKPAVYPIWRVGHRGRT